MSDKALLVGNILVAANVFELVSRTIKKVGLEYLPPLEQSIVDEQISKALTSNMKGTGE